MVCGDCASKTTLASDAKTEGDDHGVIKVQDNPAPSDSVVQEDSRQIGGEDRVTLGLEPIKHSRFHISSTRTLSLLTTVAWTLLVGSMAEIGFSIWIILKLMLLPRTFAWKSLLLPLGSFSASPESGLPIPLIPFLQTVISIFFVIFTFSSLISPKTVYLNGMKFIVWLQFIFSAPVIPIFYALWKYRQANLRQIMITAMSSASEFSKYWNMTQVSGECCGVDGPDDWGTVTGFLNSCCDPDPPNFEPLGGCYEVESKTLEMSGVTLLSSLICAVFLAGSELYALISRNELRLRLQHQPTIPDTKTFLFRQGSSVATLTVTGNGINVHQGSVLLEANGALASNVAMSENEVTLRISDFQSHSDDIKIENKGGGRIEVTVGRYGGIRGRCGVSVTTDEIELVEVKVEDPKDGAVKVVFPPLLS